MLSAIIAIGVYRFVISLVRFSVIDPIETLANGAKKIAKGQVVKLKHLQHKDEIASLILDFNTMSDALMTEKNRVEKSNNERLDEQRIVS